MWDLKNNYCSIGIGFRWENNFIDIFSYVVFRNVKLYMLFKLIGL